MSIEITQAYIKESSDGVLANIIRREESEKLINDPFYVKYHAQSLRAFRYRLVRQVIEYKSQLVILNHFRFTTDHYLSPLRGGSAWIY